MKKYLSRKFIISVAAFLGSLGTSISALHTGNQLVAGIGLFCAIISAAMYAAAEAAVDRANGTCRTYYGEEPKKEKEGEGDDK